MPSLLMTRPTGASKRFVEGLAPEIRSYVTPIYSPLLQIVPILKAIDLTGICGLVFSSSNGVGIAARLSVSRDLPCFCIGAATTDAATRAGWQARMAGETAEGLIATLLRERPDSPLLHLRGEHSRGEIAATLTQSGLQVREQIIYAQQMLTFTPEAQAALSNQKLVIAPLFSPKTARQFASLCPLGAPLWLAALSDAVAKPLDSLEFERLKIAQRPDAGAMRDAVEKLVKRALRVEGQEAPH